jgi:protein NRD1
LVDIWERGATFPSSMLASFKDKLNAAQSKSSSSLNLYHIEAHIPPDVDSNTPEGSPAPNANPLGIPQQPAAPDTSSILKALADMAKQNTTAPPAASTVAPANPLGAFSSAAATPAADPASQMTAAMNIYGGGNVATPFAGLAGMAQNPAIQPQSQSGTPNPMTAPNPLAAMLPQGAQPGVPDPNAMAQQLQLLQMLASQGIPQDQWGTALQLFTMTNNGGMGGMPGMSGMPGGPMPGFNPMQGPNVGGWGQPDSQNMDDRGREYPRSPPTGYRRRSRSPGWDRRRDASPPRRRDSPVYGEYHNESPGRRGDPRDARGRRGEYRQRSPLGARAGPGRRRSPSPARNKDPNLPPPGPKFIEWDYSIGQGMIKVLSRTLFVGGVTSSESHLRQLFGQFGIVQTCIVNVDKRHAFIKMVSRQDAMQARDGMESYRTGEMQLRVRIPLVVGSLCSDRYSLT